MQNFYLKTANLAWFLLIVSLLLYSLDYLVFGRAGDLVSSFLGNLAFLPVYVLFVTLIIERILKEREKLVMMRKMNMAIGVFFSEVGATLLRDFSGFLTDYAELTVRLAVTMRWEAKDFADAKDFILNQDFNVDCRGNDLSGLKNFLMGERQFFLGLLENPMITTTSNKKCFFWSHLYF